MSRPAIRVNGLWKEYVVGRASARNGTFYDLLAHGLKSPLRALGTSGREARESERFWALQDVSFEINPGEVVGVIGRNGAGKSTLLKVLSRITAPSKGCIEVRGRLASLLEVGTGFHPELSGRENIYLNGAILGMGRREVARKFDDIVAFAEIERFIDTPVKRYSSGMYVRLAFAVAAHLDPDILVVDEVLAVGDAEFQRKCLGKMDDVRGQGRTVLIVSHNIPMISRLCQSGIWLDKGCVQKTGEFRDVSAEYLAVGQGASSEWRPQRRSEGECEYERVTIRAPSGSTPDSIPASQPFEVEFEFVVRQGGLRGRIALQVRNEHGLPVLSSASTDGLSARAIAWNVGTHIETCEIPGHLLAPGAYSLTISQPTLTGDVILEDICRFSVDVADSLVSRDNRQGVIAPLLKWRSVN